MAKYAMLYRGHYIPLTHEGATLEEAKELALEQLYALCCEGDDKFEIIEIADHKKYNVRDYDDWFNERIER